MIAPCKKCDGKGWLIDCQWSPGVGRCVSDQACKELNRDLCVAICDECLNAWFKKDDENEDR